MTHLRDGSHAELRAQREDFFQPRAVSARSNHVYDMQLLFSRAAQAQAYTCASCAARLDVSMRRTAISTNHLRKSRIGEILATFYTTVLASATILDNNSRSIRRNQSRNVVRVDRRKISSRRQVSSLAWKDDGPYTWRNGGREDREEAITDLPRGPVDTLSSMCKTGESLSRFMESEHVRKIFLRDLVNLWSPTDNKRGFNVPHFRGPGLATLDRALKQERIIFQNHREAMTDHQFWKYHETINHLVDDLIKQAYFDEVPDDPALALRNIESLDSAWTAIRMLRSEGYPRYKSPHTDPAAAKEARNKLSETIDSLFDQERGPTRNIKPKFLVAKICYNLLVCEFPPTIHHYNALILGFSRSRMPNLVDLTVASLLQETRLRSTDQTAICLLHHYKKTRDILGFFGVIRRLVAVETRGFLRTRRRLSENILHSWLHSKDVILRPEYYWAVEVPKRTSDLYEALISGLLVFGRIKDAVKVLHASLQEGSGVSVDMLFHLFQFCLYRLHTPTLKLLVGVIMEHANTFAWLLLDGKYGPNKMAQRLYSLLSVLQPISGDLFDERAAINRTSRFRFLPHIRLDPPRLLATAMFIRNTERKLEKLDDFLLLADRSVFTAFPRDMSRTTLMLTILNEFRNFEIERARTIMMHRNLFRLIESLEKETWSVGMDKMFRKRQRVVRILQRVLPTATLRDAPHYREQAEKLEQLADNWVRYRIRKMEPVMGMGQRMVVEIELSLYYGERLMKQHEEWVPPGRHWQKPPTEEVEADWLRPDSGLLLK